MRRRFPLRNWRISDMGWILFKRALRDLKSGFARYIALSLLIVFSLFIVISLMGAADTIIDSTVISDRELNCEDGEFSVFVPLRDEELKKITDRGVSVEKMFYVDYALNGDQVLRAFKVRENINKISLINGMLPSNDSEAVIERRYSEVNGIYTGDKITIGNKVFTVTGIGATPDYNTVIKKLTDTVVDSRYFGLIFVTSEAYDELYDSGCSIASEEYYYAYVLNGAMSDATAEPTAVAITAIDLDRDTGKVSITTETVGKESGSVAATSDIYEFASGSGTLTLTCKIWHCDSLESDDWKVIKTQKVEIGKETKTYEFDLASDVDLSSGFFKATLDK